MSRPQRRERRRRLQKLTRKIDGAKATEAARKENKAVARQKSVLLENYGRLKAINGRLSPDSIASLSPSSPGLHDGKITIRGPWSDAIIRESDGATHYISTVVRGSGRSKWGKPKFVPILNAWDRREIAIRKLGIVILLEACYKGDGLDRDIWLLETGPKVLRQFAPMFTITVMGDNRSRSVRAQNSGSGKLPKRKTGRKTWQEEKSPPQVEYRLLGKSAKGKVFQETGKLDGKVLTERLSRK